MTAIVAMMAILAGSVVGVRSVVVSVVPAPHHILMMVVVVVVLLLVGLKVVGGPVVETCRTCETGLRANMAPQSNIHELDQRTDQVNAQL